MSTINLMYHDVFVGNPNESGFPSGMYKLSLSDFEEQVQCVLKCTNGGKDVVLTFDDGGVSFYYPIADVLDKYNIKGIFFISTDYIGKEGFLTEDQIKDLDSRGHIIGSHSHTHPSDISSLPKDDIMCEWRNSINILSRIIGKNVEVASIPNGYESKQVVELAEINGIKQLYTSKPITKVGNFKSMCIHGRYVVLSSTGLKGVQNIISSRFCRLCISARWWGLYVVKKILGRYYDSLKKSIVK